MSYFQDEFKDHVDPFVNGKHVSKLTDEELVRWKHDAQQNITYACYAESMATTRAEEKRWWGLWNAVVAEQSSRAVLATVAKGISEALVEQHG